MSLFSRWREQRDRNRRKAETLLRRYGIDAFDMLTRRIEETKGRDRAHWKRVERLAKQIYRNKN